MTGKPKKPCSIPRAYTNVTFAFVRKGSWMIPNYATKILRNFRIFFLRFWKNSFSHKFSSKNGHCLILGEFEARGPKDLIAIISTMLATLLGAILVKLNVLIVLSVISVGIGKLLLLVLSLKSQIFTHKPHQQPIVYEKIYYPHRGHRKDFQIPQGYYEDYPSYEISQ